MDLGRPRRVHLVGIGGAGMSGIARVLLEQGHQVSGSDLHDGRSLDELRAMGATITVPHDAAAVGDAEIVVASSAIPASNPEVVAAHDRGVAVLRRAEMLAALLTARRSILVAGTHGKTTTTSMIVVALQAVGLDPGFAIGGHLNEAGTNAHAGTDELFVAEADESDRSFLAFAPDVAVVTNVELDHPDQFEDDAAVDAAFADFLDRRGNGAPAVVCVDDPGVRRLRGRLAPPVVTYGMSVEAGLRLLIGDGSAVVLRQGGDPVALTLGVPGRHNLTNATAALAVCAVLGVDLDAAAAGLSRFQGAARRFQILGTEGGVTVVDDYAHHPTELRATLAAARTRQPDRVVLVVQPHRFSRTAVLGRELGRAAAAADVVIVTEVFGAGEEPAPGVSGRLVAEAAEAAGADVAWLPHLAEVADHLFRLVREGDLVLVTGAGDVTQLGPALLSLLRSHG